MLVGGFDSMTRAPHALRMRPALRMGDQPMIDVMVHDGLYCSIADAGMGAMSDAENARLGITREAQDEFAARSHASAAAGAERLAEEIVAARRSFAARRGRARDEPRGAGGAAARVHARRHDHGRQRLAGLRRRRGRGRHHRGPRDATRWPRSLGRAVVAGPDSTLHLRPAEASRKLLDTHGLKAADIALWEINEAFAGVVLASATALGIDLERVNVNGGAVALGHPLAGSGLRLVLTLAYELRRRGGGLRRRHPVRRRRPGRGDPARVDRRPRHRRRPVRPRRRQGRARQGPETRVARPPHGASGASTCPPACSCAPARTGTWTRRTS